MTATQRFVRKAARELVLHALDIASQDVVDFLEDEVDRGTGEKGKLSRNAKLANDIAEDEDKQHEFWDELDTLLLDVRKAALSAIK